MKTITPPAAPAKAPAAPNFEAEREAAQVNDLKEAVKAMDAISQEGFDQIISIATLALIAMESPRSALSVDHFARAFEAIVSKADSMCDCINSTAENVGANHSNAAASRRMQAIGEALRERSLLWSGGAG